MNYSFFKQKKYSAAFCIILISLFILTASASGCSKSPEQVEELISSIAKKNPEVEEVSVCKNVDENHAPVEITDSFPAGTNSIYLSVKFNNFSVNDLLKVLWIYETTGSQLSAQEFKPDEDCSGYFSFNIKVSDAFTIGNYSADVYLNNTRVKKIDFTIQ